jgi:hypothetical protein
MQRLCASLYGTLGSYFVMLCRRVVLKLGHASLFLGLGPVGGSSSLFFACWLVVSTDFI